MDVGVTGRKKRVSDTKLLQPLWPIVLLSQSLQPFAQATHLFLPSHFSSHLHLVQSSWSWW